jgi:hypothetical protein
MGFGAVCDLVYFPSVEREDSTRLVVLIHTRQEWEASVTMSIEIQKFWSYEMQKVASSTLIKPVR